MSEIDQLIQQGERLVEKQKSRERDMNCDFPIKDNEALSELRNKQYSLIHHGLKGLISHLGVTSKGTRSGICTGDFFWSLEALLAHSVSIPELGRIIFVPVADPKSPFMFSLPEGIDQWVANATKHLEEEYRFTYEPDELNPIKALDYTYYAAAYGLTLFEQENSYSEESIRAFQESFRSYFSVYKSIGEGRDLPSLEDWYPLLDTEVQIPVGLHLFKIRVLQKDWQDALRMYAHTMACFSYATLTAYEIESPSPAVEFWDRSEEGLHKEAQKAFDHIREFPQPPGGELWTEIARNVDLIIKSINRCWWDEDEQLLSYWTGAQGWLRGAKLEPGELRDELRKEEDEKAERRLKRYFFTNEQWMNLAERTRASLVDAELLWFSNQRGNPDASLVHIQMAVEDLLNDLFGCKSLSDFDRMLRSNDPITGLNTVEFTEVAKGFVEQELPNYLDELREGRNKAAHSAGKPVMEQKGGVDYLFRRFMGIGCDGILPRLADLRLNLFPNKRPPRR